MALGETRSSAADPHALHPLEAIRLLRSASGALLAQGALHGQLAWLDWTEEKERLLRMLAFTLLGFACLLCLMLAAGALVLALCWDSAARIPAMLTLLLVYGGGIAIAWRRFQRLSALGHESFAATRAEMAADLALLRSRL